MIVHWLSGQLVKRIKNTLTHNVKFRGKSDIRHLSDTLGITLEKIAVNSRPSTCIEESGSSNV